MLETVRAFARALLDDAERDGAALAHARWAADAAAAARARTVGPDAGWWTARVESLLPEFAQAVAWAVRTGRSRRRRGSSPTSIPGPSAGSAPMSWRGRGGCWSRDTREP